MKLCPKCNSEHNNNGKFCCRSCANSRTFSNESKEKKRVALKGRTHNNQIKDKAAWAEKIRQTSLQKYLNTKFDDLGMDSKRRRVLEEQNFCCSKCGISEWQGVTIYLELEHKDGNNLNNVRDNLEGLCPNCHSITDTWRGRNKPSKNGNNVVTDQFLLQCLSETKNIRQALLKAGIAAKGGNYDRAKKLLPIK